MSMSFVQTWTNARRKGVIEDFLRYVKYSDIKVNADLTLIVNTIIKRNIIHKTN